MHFIRNAKDYTPTEDDEEIFEEIADAMENVVNSHKIEMAFAALYMYTRPNGDPNIFAPGTIDGITLIFNLSPGGRLKLARDLLGDVRNSENA